MLGNYEPPDNFSRWALYIAMIEATITIAQVLNSF